MPIDQEEQQQVCDGGNSFHAQENESKIINGDHHEVHKSSVDGRNKKDPGDENKDPSAIKKGGDLESTKAEMGEVMEENQRLKQYLDQIMKDYQALQMRYYEFAQQDESKDIVNISSTPHAMKDDDDDDDGHETEVVSLSLGRSSSIDLKKSINNINTNSSSSKEKDEAADDEEEKDQQSLTLGLDCKFEASRQTSSTSNSCEDKEVGGKLQASRRPTNVIPNNNNNTKSGSGEDEVVQQPPVKKARVSVRARCDTPTMNDGCQWRKYGQKIAKGNPCPRAYYRCTVAPSCPVRKQVQRCAEDMSILITTYEGTHNHPLPISATAMASTTSAAAYMLMSGSSTSSQGSHDLTTMPMSGVEHHKYNHKYGINLNILENSQPRPFSFPNSSSSATFSPTPSHPTITLDLTSTTNNFNRVTPNFLPRYSSANLTFNATNTCNNNTLPISWPNNGSLNYGSQSYNKGQGNPIDNNSTINLNSLMSKTNLPNQQPLPDTIAQAAKVLTSDPNFQSVLTAALSSFISSNSNLVSAGNVANNSLRLIGGESNSSNTTDDFARGGVQTSATSVKPSTNKSTNGCGSSMLTIDSSTTNSLPAASLVFLSPPLPFSASKTASTSPGDTS